MPDPTNPQTLNRFAYVNNNPLTHNDPSGHYPPDDAVDSQIGFVRGIGKSLSRTAEGAVDTAKGAWSVVTNEQDRQKAMATAALIVQHPREAAEAVVNSFVEPYRQLDYTKPGDIGEALGMGITDAALILGPTKGFGKLDELAGVGKAAEGASGAARVIAPSSDWAELSGMLRAATSRKGYFTIGSATREQADALGHAWVGEGYTVASNGKILISRDGLRQYRPPDYKPKRGVTQANLEWRPEGRSEWQANAHIKIVD